MFALWRDGTTYQPARSAAVTSSTGSVAGM
jgi:hypothetical protein